MHLVFLKCLCWICSIAENLNLLGQKSIYVEHVHKNTAKAVGSRHLRFKSQHSYYGFHEACKVLCICFDQPLFGLTSHIKILGICLRISNPCKACFLKHDIVFRDSSLCHWCFRHSSCFPKMHQLLLLPTVFVLLFLLYTTVYLH